MVYVYLHFQWDIQFVNGSLKKIVNTTAFQWLLSSSPNDSFNSWTLAFMLFTNFSGRLLLPPSKTPPSFGKDVGTREKPLNPKRKQTYKGDLLRTRGTAVSQVPWITDWFLPHPEQLLNFPTKGTQLPSPQTPTPAAPRRNKWINGGWKK